MSVRRALIALLLASAAVWPARAVAPVMPIQEVTAGMEGVGRTVFEGNRVEPFKVHILGVLRNIMGPSRNLIESGKLRILFSMESKPMAALPNVPTMFTRLKTEKQRQIVSFLNAALEYGRPFAAPPGVPSERVTALRAAFASTLKDPTFLAEAEKLGYIITYTSGEELKQLSDSLYTTPRDILEEAAALLPTN